jgi:Flp pilus assembly pilin Flp
MMTVVKRMWSDEAGFIVSAELILVATIGVLAMVVGLSEVSIGINEELEDVGSAFGAINQSFCYFGATGHKGHVSGSAFRDRIDFCDGERDIVCNTPVTGESWSWGHN